jgi:hypothetical protein
VTRSDAPRLARRFTISTPLWYREHGSPKWHPGVTINVSHTGVLFRVGGAPPQTGARVDIVLALPLKDGTPAVHLRCTGQVVRARPSGFLTGGAAVAIAVHEYAREDRLPERPLRMADSHYAMESPQAAAEPRGLSCGY